MFLNHCLDYKHRNPPSSHFHHTLFHVSRALSMLRKSIEFHILFGCFVIQNKHSEKYFISSFSDETTLYYGKSSHHFLYFLKKVFCSRFNTPHLLIMKVSSQNFLYHHLPHRIIRNILNVFIDFIIFSRFLPFFKSIKFSSPFVDFISCDKCQQQEHGK